MPSHYILQAAILASFKIIISSIKHLHCSRRTSFHITQTRQDVARCTLERFLTTVLYFIFDYHTTHPYISIGITNQELAIRVLFSADDRPMFSNYSDLMFEANHHVFLFLCPSGLRDLHYFYQVQWQTHSEFNSLDGIQFVELFFRLLNDCSLKPQLHIPSGSWLS